MSDDSVTHRPRAFRYALIILAGLCLILVIGLYLLPSFLPVGTIREIINERTREEAGLEVNFANLSFTWNGGLALSGLSVTPLAGENGETPPPLATLDDVKVDVALSQLLWGNLVVERVSVSGLSLRLARDQNGALALPQPLLRTAAGSGENRGGEGDGSVSSPPSIPPLEIHLVEVERAAFSLVGVDGNTEAEVSLDFFRLEGKGLEDPFQLSGRLVPFPSASQGRGAVTFDGSARLVRNFAFDPAGEAELQVRLADLPLDLYASQLGLANLIPAGSLEGEISLAFREGRGVLEVNSLETRGLTLGLANPLALPDTSFGGSFDYDPASDQASLTALRVENRVKQVSASGKFTGLKNLASGGFPAGGIDYQGQINLASALELFKSIAGDSQPDNLPTPSGEVGFSGRVELAADSGPTARLSLAFQPGTVGLTGLIPDGEVQFSPGGLDLLASLNLGESGELAAALTIREFPLTASIPGFTQPLGLNVTGGVGVTAHLSGNTMAAELRLEKAELAIPENPWTKALNLTVNDWRLILDLEKDVLRLENASLALNDNIKLGLTGGQFTGILAGNPQGSLDANSSFMLESLAPLAGPSLPANPASLKGVLRTAVRAVLGPDKLDLRLNLQVDQLAAGLTIPGLDLAVESPQVRLELLAQAERSLNQLSLEHLTISNTGLGLSLTDANGDKLSGRVAATTFALAAGFDRSTTTLVLSSLDLKSNGLSLDASRNGQTATLAVGNWHILAASQENPARLPLLLDNPVSLPDIQVALDELTFSQDGGGEASRLGNVRVRVAVDSDPASDTSGGMPIINLRRAELLASPVAAQARGSYSPGNGRVNLEYAARFAPERVAPLLRYLQIPPELLAAAEVGGNFTWDGVELASVCQAKGALRFNAGAAVPFSLSHDFSFSYQPESQEVQVTIRSFGGSVGKEEGGTALSLSAHPSTLTLGSTGAQGFLDLRLNGEAEPTRQMALGLASLLPELRPIAEKLRTSQAGGASQVWSQIQGKDRETLVFNLGGIWQGAAFALDGQPFLAEAGKLGASCVSEYTYSGRRFNLSKFSFNSDTGQIRGEGSATGVIDLDSAGAFTGLSQLSAAFRFIFGDLTRLAGVFPGLVPSDLGLAGRVDGEFQASGNTQSLTLEKGQLNLRDLKVLPDGLNLSSSTGTAVFQATLGLNPPGSYRLDDSDYAFLRAFNLAGGAARLDGATVYGQPLNTFEVAFQLITGQLRLDALQVGIAGEPGESGGRVKVAGQVDFNSAVPAVDIRLGVVTLPLKQFSPEFKEFFTINSGILNLPPTQGENAAVAFRGLTLPEVLASIKLDNFRFATGPLVVETGPEINAQLDHARSLLKMEAKEPNSSDRVFSFTSITGSVVATGQGGLTIPGDAPLYLTGDNTGDFLVRGDIRADQTLQLEAMLANHLEKVLAFSLPSLIPNLSNQPRDEQSQFMNRMNANAQAEHYKLKVTGPMDSPAIGGIPELVGRMLTDIPLAAPFAVIGGVVNLGRNVTGGLGRGVGGLIGNLANPGGQSDAAASPDASTAPETGETTPDQRPNLLRGLLNRR
ncbi:MAG: AsmA family protein [Planctomycetota bacterium]|jgi:hypothetical protein|nr:AsmA family protein [Planctomycetota bacterium]